MNIRKHIPNTITSLNLLCGVLSLVWSLHLKQPALALWFILAAALFDFFDGLAARLLHVSSPYGKELDSLADVVSFGVAPAALVYSAFVLNSGMPPHWMWMASPIFLTAVFAGLRLAKFNIDTRQTTSFIGVPVPANALFWIGVFALMQRYEWAGTSAFIVVGVCAVLFSWLMVSEIPMFSLKVHDLKWRGNEFRYVLIIGSIALLAFFGLGGLAPAILLYVVLSLVSRS